MVKHNTRVRQIGQVRIGFGDAEPLWDSENEKYKVLCRSIHVSKASFYIGYVRLLVSLVSCIFFAYQYMMAVTGQMSADNWINQMTARFMSKAMLAICLQVIVVVLMIHGVKTEKKSMLLPFIVYSGISVLANSIKIMSDLVYLDMSTYKNDQVESQVAKIQFVSDLMRMVLHAWCLSVVWRCYGYLTEKKVARQIREQLISTATAFNYPENLVGHSMMPQQPPPYASVVPAPIVIGPPSDKPQPSPNNNSPAAASQP
ncbi:hypothetical protein GPALN_006132 [Globodera pallida]|nr:hypothetical protein GPALN_006132 [Globodera pallida]KAI3409754.1 hypothetical protein GPALN_006132 [Globodera pallida]